MELNVDDKILLANIEVIKKEKVEDRDEAFKFIEGLMMEKFDPDGNSSKTLLAAYCLELIFDTLEKEKRATITKILGCKILAELAEQAAKRRAKEMILEA